MCGGVGFFGDGVEEALLDQGRGSAGRGVCPVGMDFAHGSVAGLSSARLEAGLVVGVRPKPSAAQCVEGLCKEVFPGIRGTELQQDAAHADADDGADLEQLQPDGIDLRLGPLGAFQAQPAQRLHQRVGQCGEVEAQLVALHFVGREPVGEQGHLLLDAVFHLAAGAVELLVEILWAPLFGRERGNHEARVLPLVEILGFGHDAARSRPALFRLVLELGEDTGRLAAALMHPLRLMHLGAGDALQALIAGQAEGVIHRIGLAPGHQLLAAEAAVGAQHDPDLGPALPQLRHDAADLLDRACRHIPVGSPEPRAQQLVAGEDIQRQVAVAVVID